MAEKHSNIFQRLAQSVLRHKTISVGATLLILAGLFTWHLYVVRSGGGTYLTAAAAYGNIASTVSANGNVIAVQDVTLTFENQGFVQTDYVKQGDLVKTGQVLAQENQNDMHAQLEQATAALQNAQANYQKLVATQPQLVDQARAQLTQAQSNLNLAKTTLGQDQSLFAAGAVSRSTLTSAENAYQNADSQYRAAQSNLAVVGNTGNIAIAAAQVKSAQAQLTLARDNLAGTQIIAPFDGYVATVNGNVGQWTQGGAPPPGTAISSQFSITLVSTQLELQAEVNEADISKVRNGQDVTFTVDTHPNQIFNGQITSLSPLGVDIQGVQYYNADVAISNYQELKAGMPAAVTIISAQKNHVLVIPRSALDYARTYLTARGKAYNSGKDYVIVLTHGQPVATAVDIGLINNSEAEVVSGLQAGQEVVMGAGINLPAKGGGKAKSAFPHGPGL